MIPRGPLKADDKMAEITAIVCGGKQAKRCLDGGAHDMSAIIKFADGGTVACVKCGMTALDIDLLELP